MGFDELCLMYENITLLKANYGRKLSADEYTKTIDGYIKRISNSGLGSINLFLNKPFAENNCMLNLRYYFVQTPSSPPMPANSFKYELPETTLRKFRSNPNIRNPRLTVYFKPQVNVFFLNNKPVKKVFSKNYLRDTMKELIEVNNFFEANYGKEYSFLGDIYVKTEETTYSKLAASWEKTKEGWKNLPKDLGAWIKNI